MRGTEGLAEVVVREFGGKSCLYGYGTEGPGKRQDSKITE